MKRLVLALGLFMLCAQVFIPQDNQLKIAQKEEPKTKLEAFLITKGSLLIKEIITIKDPWGTFKGPSMTLQAISLYEPNKEDEKIRGIKIEVYESTGSSSLSRNESAFLDLEEVDNVLNSIDYIIEVSSKWQNLDTGKKYTAVEYSTKGEFKIGAYHEGKEQRAYISCGRVMSATGFFKTEDLTKVKDWIKDALSKLNP